jgi:SRSO17 transposase
VERKNGWQIAEWVGDLTPDGIQRLLSTAKWDADLVRDDLQCYVKEYLADPRAVLIVDETGFPKQGRKSVGVQRQYCGRTGRVENCQVGVFAGYASAKGATFMDRELYLPQSWVQDDKRRREAGVPDTIGTASKSELARQMIKRVLATGIPFAWVAADALYGDDITLRTWLEDQRLPYVLAVHSDEPVVLLTEQGMRSIAVRDCIPLLAEQDWQAVSMGEGTKGPRVSDWACLPIFHGEIQDSQHWLLIRRSATDRTELTFYLVYGPQGTTLQEMVWVAGARWKIEEILETAKGEVGLDHYQVRLWTSWYRHITLTMFAHAYLTVMRAQSGEASFTHPGEAAEELLPLTVPEVRHVLWQIVWPHAPPLWFVLAWSSWRRRHQARAKRVHTKHRWDILQGRTSAPVEGECLPGQQKSKSHSEKRKGTFGPRLLTMIQYSTDDEYLLINQTGAQSSHVADGSEWQATLEKVPSFHFSGKHGHFTARKEQVHGKGFYWYAYRRYHNKQSKQYIATTAKLSPDTLEQAAVALEAKIVQISARGGELPRLKRPDN